MEDEIPKCAKDTAPSCGHLQKKSLPGNSDVDPHLGQFRKGFILCPFMSLVSYL